MMGNPKVSFTNKVKNGILWNSFLAFGRQGLNLIASIILARLLNPSDYGLIGMIAIFIGVSEGLVDAGLGGALIKKKEVKNIDYSTLSTYNIVISILIYSIIFLIAPLIANIYNHKILTTLLRIYSLTILIDAIAIVPKIKLTREFNFKVLSLSTVFSGLIGLCTAIIMAINGYGVYSLIAQYIVSSLICSTLLVMYSKTFPKIGFQLSSFKELFSFVVNTTLANVLNSFTENLFTNIIAKTSSLTVTGYYNQSYKIQNVLSSIQQRIVDGALFPIISREEDKDIVRISLKLNMYSCYALSFIYYILVINADIIVKILLGEKWLGATIYLQLLLIMGLLQNITLLNRNLLKSLAKTLDILLIECISLLFVGTCLVIIPLNTKIVLALVILYSIVRLSISMIVICKKEKITNIWKFLKGLTKEILPSTISFIIATCIFNCKVNLLVVNICFCFLTILLSEVQKPLCYVNIKRELSDIIQRKVFK